jgi:proline iminopeptidase
MPSVTTSDGRVLSYDVRGDGDLLVCHPGGPGFSGAYLGELGGLARFRALVLWDPRGTGGSSPAGSPEAYALDDYVADLDVLQNHLGIERIDLLGHSHGSLVALLYAARYPDRISRLVLVAVGTRFHEQQLDAMQTAMRQRSREPWFDDASAALEEEQKGKFCDDAALGRLVARELPFYFAHYGEKEREFVSFSFGQPVHAAALRYFNAHEFLTFDLRPALSEVAAPTFVVAGEKDFILGPPASREVAEGIASARFKVLDNVGHFPWVESPEQFVALISAFLSN